MRRARQGSQREPTIALINVVFLMLVFFMIAGTLAQPLDKEVRLVRTADLEGRAPPDALVVQADGRLSYLGRAIATPEDYAAMDHPAGADDEAGPTLRILPDRDLPAERLVQIAGALRAAGAGRILIVTERGLE